MADMFGYSFTPDLQNRMRQTVNNGLPANASEALRILSLRLPAILGGRPIAPEGLLAGGGPGAFRPGPVDSTPLDTTGIPKNTAGNPAPPVRFNPSDGLGNGLGQPLANPTASGPAPSPTIGFGGGNQPAPPVSTANPVDFVGLLNSLFSGVDVGGGRGMMGGGGRFA